MWPEAQCEEMWEYVKGRAFFEYCGRTSLMQLC